MRFKSPYIITIKIMTIYNIVSTNWGECKLFIYLYNLYHLLRCFYCVLIDKKILSLFWGLDVGKPKINLILTLEMNIYLYKQAIKQLKPNHKRKISSIILSLLLIIIISYICNTIIPYDSQYNIRTPREFLFKRNDSCSLPINK